MKSLSPFALSPYFTAIIRLLDSRCNLSLALFTVVALGADSSPTSIPEVNV